MLAHGRNATSRVEDEWRCRRDCVGLRCANLTYFHVKSSPVPPPPFPRRQGVGIHPEACLPCPRFALGEFVTVLIFPGLFSSVVPIPPGKADRELCQSSIQRFRASIARIGTGIRRRNHDFSDDSPMVVTFFILDRNGFIEQQAEKMLFGATAKSLSQLRRVNACEPNSVAHVRGIFHGNGIAIGNIDNAACQ